VLLTGFWLGKAIKLGYLAWIYSAGETPAAYAAMVRR
jgi:hypothetical protein